MTTNCKLCEMIEGKLPIEGGLYLRSALFTRRTRKLVLSFCTKGVVTAQLKEELMQVVHEILPQLVRTFTIDVKRIYFDDQILQDRVRDFYVKQFPSVAVCMDFSTLRIEHRDEEYRVTMQVDEVVKAYNESNRIQFMLEDRLSEQYFERFVVEFTYKIIVSNNEIADKQKEVYRRPENLRRIYPIGVELFVGKMIDDPAMYIIDMEKPLKYTTLCGTIRNLTYRFTKTEKHMFKFSLEDYTGRMTCLCFATEKNLMKLQELVEGMVIVASGELTLNEKYSDMSLMVRNIGTCQLPSDFIPAPLPSLPAEDTYKVIYPQHFERHEQDNLFIQADTYLCEELRAHTYVVFDTETTGLASDLDRIIEIGAVRIQNGMMVESFTTLINPERAIPEVATKINNITDEMVLGCPTLKEVMPDFYKFTRDAILVAHNIDFDIKFIQFAAKKMGYFFDNELMDTLQLAKLLIKHIPNYKQESVANYFGIETGEKHRALDDTICCAEMFIKLMNLKYPQTQS